MTAIGSRSGTADDGHADALNAGIVSGTDWAFTANIVGGTAALGSTAATGGTAWLRDPNDATALMRSLTPNAVLAGLIPGTLPAAGQFVAVMFELAPSTWGGAATVSLKASAAKATKAEAEANFPAATAGHIQIRKLVITNTGGVYSIASQFDTRSYVNGVAGEFGDGSDGSVTLDATLEYAGFATRVGSVYTLTRDLYAAQLTVNAGVTLKTNNFMVFCTGTITSNGTISNDGAAGTEGNNAANVAGTGGGAGGSNAVNGSLLAGQKGGAGGGFERAGESGGGTFGRSIVKVMGGIQAGAGGNYVEAGGGSGEAALPIGGRVRQVARLLLSAELSGGVGGGGGGGGKGGSLGGGGGGGAGGGVVLLCCRYLSNSGTLSAKGGAGAFLKGGGGAGGAIVLIVGGGATGGTSVAGGTGNKEGATGTPGENGGTGFVYRLEVTG